MDVQHNYICVYKHTTHLPNYRAQLKYIFFYNVGTLPYIYIITNPIREAHK